MTLQVLFWLIAVILATVSAWWSPGRPSLLSLSVAFFAAGFVVGGVDITAG